MSARRRFHVEVLPPAQRLALGALAAPATREGFYLAGGTALALQLGHRRSLDLDWFSESGPDDPDLLAARLSAAGIALTVESTAPGKLEAQLGAVRTTFLAYRYPLLAPLVRARGLGCRLADVTDIACMELAAVAQRGLRRDFVDLHAICRAGHSLATLLGLFREKYGMRDIGHVLVALTYFDDAERDPALPGQTPDAWSEIKRTMVEEVRRLVG